MRELLKNKTVNYTSPPMTVTQNPYAEMYIQVSGVATVAIESLGADGVYRSFPETTVTGPYAGIVSVPQGKFRAKVTVGTATAIEMFW